jgi:predicted nucleic acid-binding protein
MTAETATSTAPVWAEPLYVDASALVKLFVPEPESDMLNRSLLGAEDVVLSDLAVTEMASALGRRVREGTLLVSRARQLQREAEKLAAACRRVELTPPIHRRAERLLLSSRDVPLRALDALHLATALDVSAATVVTFDPRLRAAAVAQSLFVAPSR